MIRKLKYLFITLLFYNCFENKKIEDKDYDDIIIGISNVFYDYYINNVSFSGDIEEYNTWAVKNFNYNLSDTLKKHNLKVIFINNDKKNNIGYMILKSQNDFENCLNENQLLNFIKENNIKKNKNLNYVNDNVMLYIENEYSLIMQSNSIPDDQVITKFWQNRINYFGSIKIDNSNFKILDNLDFNFSINDSVLISGKLHNKFVKDMILYPKSKFRIKGFKKDKDLYFINTIVELDSIYNSQEYYLLENYEILKLELE